MIGVLVQFDRKDWALVGLLIILNLPRILVGLVYDPFGVFMNFVGAFIGACVGVYVLKWVFRWFRVLPDAE